VENSPDAKKQDGWAAPKFCSFFGASKLVAFFGRVTIDRHEKTNMRYFILNKPPGCITGRTDPEGRETVYDHVPDHFPALPHVGRLDYNTEGLLLFTDDGRLHRALLSGELTPEPVEKTYHVKVRPKVGPEDPRLKKMILPLKYGARDEILTRPARVSWVAERKRSVWIEVVLTEGRHRQVRHLCRRSGFQIVKLRRVSLGPLALGDLTLRWCRTLVSHEVQALYEAALPGESPPPFEPVGA
jgi:23S rRNA pseudouridine2605 synthase